MRTRVGRWLIGASLGLAVVYGLLFGQARPTTVYGADPTPTPTEAGQTNDPGSGGGGGGGHGT